MILDLYLYPVFMYIHMLARFIRTQLSGVE